MEPLWSQVAHGVSATGVMLILGVMFKQHKVFVRMKDRLNSLWYYHCVNHTKERYESLENGTK